MFFPAGALASIVGVALWPLVYAGWLGYYPGEAHARIMIQGFVGGFALGFLGTAFPKMIESPSLTWSELSILLASYTGCVVTHTYGKIAFGDSFFLFTWLFMIASLSIRLVFFRKDLPPPGFVLAGMGLVAGIVGVAMLLIGRIVAPSAFQYNLARLFLYEGFILGPIIGIGGFLFPRFLHLQTSRQEQPSWNRRALSGTLAGTLVLGTYLTQASGFTTMSPVIRAGVVTIYLFSQIFPFGRAKRTGTLSFMLQGAVAFLLLGILVSGVSSVFHQVGVRHLLYVGGYGLLIVTIATRVSWGHSGNIDLAEGRRHSLRFIFGFVFLAMATRIVADFIPTIRISHLVYAALSWIVAVVIWSWAVLRYVKTSENEID